MPKHITTSTIDYFNEGKLKYLFCTTTIIEGVNTSAKNIVYFDKTKGKNTPIDFFDYSNIKGRAGRMMVHLVGKIYNFNEPPAKNEETIVDIPFFEQNPIADEILINLDKGEIRDYDSEQNQHIQNIPQKAKELIKKNGVSVRGQERIIGKLLQESDTSLFTWSGYPKYKQLQFALGLAWENLLKPTESKEPVRTLKGLTFQTFNYAHGKAISAIIQEKYEYLKPRNQSKTDAEILDQAIKDTFQVFRHWFEYKVPKWLNVIHVLQEYVCEQRGIQPGSYIFYSSVVESGNIPPHLAILLEYNIPATAIKKLKNKVPENIKEDDLLSYILKNKLSENSELIEYEQDFFKKI